MASSPNHSQDQNPSPDKDDDDESTVADTYDDQRQKRVRILPGSSNTAASFEFLDEGHTLGNVLRYVIMKNPDVEFCAYAIPHPSEAKMNVRIQTYGRPLCSHPITSQARQRAYTWEIGTPATEALKKGLADVQDMCDVVATEFWKQRKLFEDTVT